MRFDHDYLSCRHLSLGIVSNDVAVCFCHHVRQVAISISDTLLKNEIKFHFMHD